MSHARGTSPWHSFVVTVALLGSVLAGAARAQDAPVVISGQVLDQTGGALPGATIVVRDAATGRERTTTSDQAGRFVIDKVIPGQYVVTVSLPGFETLTREAVTAGAEVAPLRVVLAVSSVQDAVVVRGTALNYANAIAAKRADDRVVDTFGADEIGRLPDKNIGETLNRIPGVSMLLEKGEGRFIQIRGISPRLNSVTINGMTLGSGETEGGGRLTPLDVIGGELLGGVQVIKTRTPDMDGQGIGGTLNLTTKQPFDFEKPFTAMFSARGGLETIDSLRVADTKETPYTWDTTLAGKLRGNTVGWLLGASFSNRMTPLLGIYQDDWRPVAFGAATINYPTDIKNNVTVTARERLNLNGGFEVRPNDATRFFVRSFYAHWDELQLRNRYNEGLSDRLISVDGAAGGTISGNRVQVNLRSEPTDKELLSVTVGGSHHLGPWTIDYTALRNDGRVHEPNVYWEFRSGSSTFGPDTFQIQDDGTVAIASTGRDRQDPAFQGFRRVRMAERLSEEDSYGIGFDVRRDLLLGGSKPAFVKAGAKFSRTARATDNAQQVYNAGTEAWTAAMVPSMTRGAFTNPVPLRGVPNIWLDLDGLMAFFGANQGDPRFFRFDAAGTHVNEFQSDFSLRERVTSAYVMSKVDFGRLSLVGGVRVEQTDVDSSAFTIVNAGGRREARPIAGDGAYTNVLPSIIGTLNLRHDLVARAAFTSAIGRPEFTAIAPRSVLGIEDNPAIGTIGTLSIGNPDLTARQSNNVDLSLEWYFARGALLSAAVFRKNISDEIVPAPTGRLTGHVFEGQHFDRFDINTTINAKNAYVHGVELTFADQFTFLPAPFDGLGVGGSVTLLGSGVDIARGGEVLRLPLLEQADRATSLTAYYQKGRWDLSGTYKYNSNFWTDYGSVRALDLDQGAFGRVDMRVQYELTPAVKLTFSGINLNDEPTSEFQGGNRRQNTEYEYTGRTLLVGVSARVGR